MGTQTQTNQDQLESFLSLILAGGMGQSRSLELPVANAGSLASTAAPASCYVNTLAAPWQTPASLPGVMPEFMKAPLERIRQHAQFISDLINMGLSAPEDTDHFAKKICEEVMELQQRFTGTHVKDQPKQCMAYGQPICPTV